jgi:hypothetical protein
LRYAHRVASAPNCHAPPRRTFAVPADGPEGFSSSSEHSW